MEQKNVKIFYKPVDGGELKEIECVAESGGFELEPLKEPIDVKYDPTFVTKGYSLSFDITLNETQTKNIRKLFKMRIPRKKKKKAKKWLARQRCDIYCYIKHLRYNYMGTFYWIK
jgi:hypothetical protein